MRTMLLLTLLSFAGLGTARGQFEVVEPLGMASTIDATMLPDGALAAVYYLPNVEVRYAEWHKELNRWITERIESVDMWYGKECVSMGVNPGTHNPYVIYNYRRFPYEVGQIHYAERVNGQWAIDALSPQTNIEYSSHGHSWDSRGALHVVYSAEYGYIHAWKSPGRSWEYELLDIHESVTEWSIHITPDDAIHVIGWLPLNPHVESYIYHYAKPYGESWQYLLPPVDEVFPIAVSAALDGDGELGVAYIYGDGSIKELKYAVLSPDGSSWDRRHILYTRGSSCQLQYYTLHNAAPYLPVICFKDATAKGLSTARMVLNEDWKISQLPLNKPAGSLFKFMQMFSRQSLVIYSSFAGNESVRAWKGLSSPY